MLGALADLGAQQVGALWVAHVHLRSEGGEISLAIDSDNIVLEHIVLMDPTRYGPPYPRVYVGTMTRASERVRERVSESERAC